MGKKKQLLEDLLAAGQRPSPEALPLGPGERLMAAPKAERNARQPGAQAIAPVPSTLPATSRIVGMNTQIFEPPPEQLPARNKALEAAMRASMEKKRAAGTEREVSQSEEVRWSPYQRDYPKEEQGFLDDVLKLLNRGY